MPLLRVTQTGQRMAFDIVEGAPGYESRHMATAVHVRYRDVSKTGRLRTYSNDSRPFGPTIRHYRNISENFIDRLHLHVGQELLAEVSILPDGSHLYEILNLGD